MSYTEVYEVIFAATKMRGVLDATSGLSRLFSGEAIRFVT
jgi:hypothetical protein